MWRRSAEVAFDDEPVARETPPIDEDAIEAAAKLLGKAKNPLIIVGGGALDASAEVQAIAEALQAPVVAYRTGLGVLDHRHHLSHRLPAGYKLWKGVDVVLGIGTRLQQQLDWGTDDDLKVVHLDIDPNTHRPHPQARRRHRRGCSRRPARADRAARQAQCASAASRESEMQGLKAALADELSPLAPQKTWIDAIRAELPEDGILVEELTQISYASRILYPVYGPRTYLTTGYQGTLGWGLPTALGAKVAMPDRAVVSVSGDGGFMFGVQELATAAKHNIPVVCLVFTDDAYGNVRRIQQDNYEGRVVASDLANPDFVKLGASFGLRAERAKTPKALRKAMSEAMKANEPSLIEIPVGVFPDPWRYFMRPRVRGQR